MPSEDSLVVAALEAMQAPAEAFHSALARAVEDLSAFIVRHRKSAGDPEDLVAAELGAFGAGHLNARRFSALLARPDTLEPPVSGGSQGGGPVVRHGPVRRRSA